MAVPFPGSLVPWIAGQFCDAEGHPLVGGLLYSYVAGTDTPRPTYTNVDLTTPHTNPIVLDAGGRAESPIFVGPGGYKFLLTDADDVPIFTIDHIEDVGATFAAQFGLVMSQGGKNVTSGYTVLDSDRLVTVNSTGGADPCIINLLPAADATQPVTIKNMGIIGLEVTPNGADTIDGLSETFDVPPQDVASIYPAITLVSDGVNAWHIISSHWVI